MKTLFIAVITALIVSFPQGKDQTKPNIVDSLNNKKHVIIRASKKLYNNMPVFKPDTSVKYNMPTCVPDSNVKFNMPVVPFIFENEKGNELDPLKNFKKKKN